MGTLTWFEQRGVADAVVEVVFDGDRKGNFPEWFQPSGEWFAVPLLPQKPLPGLPARYVYDFRIILDGLQPRPRVTYRLDGFALSPETTELALPVGARFSIFPGRVVGHGTVIEWLGR
jgi:hypothetical protein